MTIQTKTYEEIFLYQTYPKKHPVNMAPITTLITPAEVMFSTKLGLTENPAEKMR